eukprot:2911776-Prymnesium_polylepis.2
MERNAGMMNVHMSPAARAVLDKHDVPHSLVPVFGENIVGVYGGSSNWTQRDRKRPCQKEDDRCL